MKQKRSLVAAATATIKQENQDNFEMCNKGRVHALFIADGLGGYSHVKHAKCSSARVVAFFRNKTESIQHKRLSSRKIKELYAAAREDLRQYAATKRAANQEYNSHHQFGTTAITIFETREKIWVAYTGNGAVWHIRANLQHFATQPYFPWSAVNILNPHSIPQSGQERLYRLLCDQGKPEDGIPSIIEITKDDQAGDIIMACTDGVYSADQRKIGQSDSGVWLQCERPILNFFEQLQLFVQQQDAFNNERLTNFLQRYLTTIIPVINDDATIGMLITEAAIQHLQAVKS